MIDLIGLGSHGLTSCCAGFATKHLLSFTSMCFLDSPKRMQSERFWAKQALITTTRVHEPTLHTFLSCREAWTLGYAAQFPVIDRNAYASAAGSIGCRQFFSWDPLWRKPLAEESCFAQSHTSFWGSLQGRTCKFYGGSPLPQWGPSEEPRQCQSFHTLRWGLCCSLIYCIEVQLLPLPTDVAFEHSPINFLPWDLCLHCKLQGIGAAPETWRLGFELWRCLFLTLGLGVNFLLSKMGIIKNTL